MATNTAKMGLRVWNDPNDHFVYTELANNWAIIDTHNHDGANSQALANNSVGSNQIAANAVTAAKIPDGSITNVKIPNSEITGGKLATSTVPDTALASPNNGLWRNYAMVSSMGVAMVTGAVYFFGAGLFLQAGTFYSTNSPTYFPINPTDVAVANKTASWRIGAVMTRNTVSTTNTWTIGLAAAANAGGSSGNMSYSSQGASLGLVGNTLDLTGAPFGLGTIVYSTPFSTPTNGIYQICMQMASNMAAGSACHISAWLQVRYI